MTATQAQGLHSPHSARLLIFAESGDTFTVVTVVAVFLQSLSTSNITVELGASCGRN